MEGPFNLTAGVFRPLTCIVIDRRAREAPCGRIAVGHGASKVGETEPNDLSVVVELVSVLLSESPARLLAY